MSDTGDSARSETTSTTFTFNKETERFLQKAYPDAIGTSERLRMAIADARKVNDFFAAGGDELVRNYQPDND